MKSPKQFAPLLIAGAVCAFAEPVQAQQINVTVDGEVINFSGQPPVQQFGTVLVPLRGVFEKLGANVMYNAPTKTIQAQKGTTQVQLQIGSSQAIVNGEIRQLSQPAQVVQGSTLVPLRFVSEALGAQVQWKGASRTVVIATSGATGGTGENIATNPTPATDDELRVTSLTHDASGALRNGEKLTVTLKGTPGALASFSIPGIAQAQSVAMKEVSPGTYQGQIMLPANANIQEATVLGTLKKNGKSSPTLQAAQTLTVDTVGPTLGSLSPQPNAALAPGKPLIYGTLSDAGTGVEPNRFKLVVNGVDQTSKATVTNAFFSYQPENPLPMGKNTVQVTVQDNAGNATTRDWSFTLSQAEALIQEISYEPKGQTLEPGDVLTVRMTAKPNGQAVFNVGGTVTGRPMQEVSPGVYQGSYTVKKGDSLAKAPISVAFTQNGRTVTQSAEQGLTIAAGAPEKPVVTSPEAGSAVGGTVTIRGKAAPNSTVRYHLKYALNIPLVQAGGTVVDGEVKANAQGEWVIENVSLPAPLGFKDVEYTLEAETVGAAGEASEKTTVQFKR
ncbi:MAG: hypothetical protein OHK0029_01340 [Armatimonadaceae bacterium]